MARYFMHLRDSTDELLDSEGVELVDLEAVRQSVMSAARDMLAGDLRDGIVDLRYRIDAETEGGAIVHSLPSKAHLALFPSAHSMGNAADLRRYAEHCRYLADLIPHDRLVLRQSADDFDAEAERVVST